MKYFILITVSFGLLVTSCVSQGNYDYSDDTDPNDGFEEEYESPKPVYKLEEAPKIFEKFITDFNKKYRDGRDRMKHFKTFVKSLKEINTWNSDVTSTSTLDINMFSDLTEEERAVYLGGGDAKPARATYEQKSVIKPFAKAKDFLEGPALNPIKSFAKLRNYEGFEAQKPLYKLEDAPKLFEKFTKDYNKIYENERDRLKHYNTFVKNLKEMNALNSNNEFSETVEIDIFADLSPFEKASLLEQPNL